MVRARTNTESDGKVAQQRMNISLLQADQLSLVHWERAPHGASNTKVGRSAHGEGNEVAVAPEMWQSVGDR